MRWSQELVASMLPAKHKLNILLDRYFPFEILVKESVKEFLIFSTFDPEAKFSFA